MWVYVHVYACVCVCGFCGRNMRSDSTVHITQLTSLGPELMVAPRTGGVGSAGGPRGCIRRCLGTRSLPRFSSMSLPGCRITRSGQGPPDAIIKNASNSNTATNKVFCNKKHLFIAKKLLTIGGLGRRTKWVLATHTRGWCWHQSLGLAVTD